MYVALTINRISIFYHDGQNTRLTGKDYQCNIQKMNFVFFQYYSIFSKVRQFVRFLILKANNL